MTSRKWALGAAEGGENLAWSEVAAAMKVSRLVRARQVHGVAVLIDRAGASTSCDADIILSDDPSAAIAIQTADCVPLLIADRRRRAVAAAHAGWRGLAAGVPRVALAALADRVGARPEDLIVAAGPSIGACCYEVGPEVRQRFHEEGWPESATSRWFFPAPRPTDRNPSMARVHAGPRPGHWYFDSGLAVREQLESAGVPREQIFVADLCTASHPEVLCSYRRDGAGAGRMAAAIRPAKIRSG